MVDNGVSCSDADPRRAMQRQLVQAGSLAPTQSHATEERINLRSLGRQGNKVLRPPKVVGATAGVMTAGAAGSRVMSDTKLSRSLGSSVRVPATMRQELCNSSRSSGSNADAPAAKRQKLSRLTESLEVNVKPSSAKRQQISASQRDSETIPRVAKEKDEGLQLSLEQQWQKHSLVWNKALRIKRADGDVVDCFEVVQDPFGIRCKICAEACAAGVIKSSLWTKFEHRGSRRADGSYHLQLEDLKRHCNLSASQAKGRVPRSKAHAIAMDSIKARHVEEVVVDVARSDNDDGVAPSPEQLRIAIELCWGWGGYSLVDYEKRCETSRKQGGNVPHVRSSRWVARNLLIAAAEVEFAKDRELYIPQALEISWAQDAANDHLLMKYRAVLGNFVVIERMIDIFRVQGERALQCAKDMEKGLQRLCSKIERVAEAQGDEVCAASMPCPDAGPSEQGKESNVKKMKFNLVRATVAGVKEKFQEVCRNANADGAPNEQLGLRLAKACATLPNLDFITRAEEHSCSLVLKRAADSCPWLMPMFLCLIPSRLLHKLHS